MNDQDTLLIKAYTSLSSLRKNIINVQGKIVIEIYINEYHGVLDKLKNIGIEVDDYYIPKSTIKSYGILGQGVELTYFLTKIDAILGYFEIITSPEKRQIGYRKPQG